MNIHDQVLTNFFAEGHGKRFAEKTMRAQKHMEMGLNAETTARLIDQDLDDVDGMFTACIMTTSMSAHSGIETLYEVDRPVQDSVEGDGSGRSIVTVSESFFDAIPQAAIWAQHHRIKELPEGHWCTSLFFRVPEQTELMTFIYNVDPQAKSMQLVPCYTRARFHTDDELCEMVENGTRLHLTGNERGETLEAGQGRRIATYTSHGHPVLKAAGMSPGMQTANGDILCTFLEEFYPEALT